MYAAPYRLSGLYAAILALTLMSTEERCECLSEAEFEIIIGLFMSTWWLVKDLNTDSGS